jgi:pyrroline-5-carboxylate reductase
MTKIGFIGAGNMAGALIKGLLRAEVCKPADICVSDVAATQVQKLRRQFKVIGAANNRTVLRNARTVVLSVKPQVMAAVLADLRPAATTRHLFVSIAAGIPLRRLETGLGKGMRVVRVMPNTPALIGQGMSVAVPGKHATAADLRHTLRLFQAVGRAEAVTRERLIDPVTAVSGSGPAFVYLFAEHLIAGGTKAGLSPALAARLTFQTILGAAGMMLETDLSPRALREMVSSPGGTTLAGLTALDAHHFRDAVLAAIQAATRRARELAAS